MDKFIFKTISYNHIGMKIKGRFESDPWFNLIGTINIHCKFGEDYIVYDAHLLKTSDPYSKYGEYNTFFSLEEAKTWLIDKAIEYKLREGD